ncbi:MAG: hypothetical protein DRI61_03610 [Chloroflexi bacterium]|nr:MAG: hypothetical protein DRI61_03610 [Chloroflexota bacterium]
MSWLKSRFKRPSSLLGLTVPLAFLLLFVLVISLTLAAVVTIDTFDEGSQTATAGPDAGSSASNYVNTTVALGGQRDIYVYNSIGGGHVSIAVDYGDTNQAKFNQDSDVKGWGEIVWDGKDDDATSLDTTGLGGEDLTDGNTNNGFQLQVYRCDGGFDLGIWVYTGTATAYYTLTIDSAVDPPGQSFFIKFSNFTGDQSVFSDAGAIVLRIIPDKADVDLTIDLFESTTNTDWGDLPDDYKTLADSNGPRHIRSELYLGHRIDVEINGFPSTDALGDDNNILDDEDGIVRVPGELWQPNNTVHITATVTGGTGDLYAWFDWDNDNDFSDESRYSWLNLAPGDHRLALTVGSNFSYQNASLAARFRLVPQGADAPDYYGEVNGGEVEDYIWQFGPNAVTLSKLEAKTPSTGWLVALFVTGVLGAGALGLVVVRRRKGDFPA